MISHPDKCVFVHVPKAAGQSIEYFFLQRLGLEPKSRLPLLLGPNHEPSIGPPKLAHLLARDYVKHHYLSQELFDRYFKFAFVRNPWDRIVSLYKFEGFSQFVRFDGYVNRYLSRKLWTDQTRFWSIRPQADYVLDEQGQLLVDFIGKFENLRADFHTVCQHLGLAGEDPPHRNALPQETNFRRAYHTLKRNPELMLKIFGRRDRHSHYRDYYSESSRQIVGELYAQDVALFQYEF